MKRNSMKLSAFLLLGLTVMAGCSDPNAQAQDYIKDNTKVPKDYTPSARAGIDKDVSKSMDPKRLQGLIAATNRFGSRQNPFALSADEIAFDRLQASEKLLQDGGNFGTQFELPESRETEETVAFQEQPIRRLSGIVIGDAVYAILEENGSSTIIYPGFQVPNSDWTVASIDSEKAVFRRDPKLRPNEIEVRLQVGLPSFAGGGQDNGMPTGAPGGMPTAGPGGGPGGRGGAPRGGGGTKGDGG
jgi:hypothetical protein